MKYILIFCFTALSMSAYAQKYKANKSHVRFFSEATLENIAADNADGASIYNEDTDDIVFSIPISSFEFKKSLMKEHFNENYMESEKYPKAIFKGAVTGFEKDSNGKQKVSAKGDMTIHGVTRQITVDGTMERKGDDLLLESKFVVRLEDYDVKIPQVLWQNIAEEVEVTLKFNYKPL